VLAKEARRSYACGEVGRESAFVQSTAVNPGRQLHE
jgi:hypothetical protein